MSAVRSPVASQHHPIWAKWANYGVGRYWATSGRRWAMVVDLNVCYKFGLYPFPPVQADDGQKW